MEQGVGGISGYYISLGQPVYIQGMFFGLEFPAAETEIEDSQKVRIRYYSGKSFEMLASEGRLGESGTFTTWKEVIGATRSTDMDVIQTDFFSYIHDIAVPVGFRIQYNSWYDFMLNINENNILNSFREVERGLTQNGVRPIDSYVMDDGWNAYVHGRKRTRPNSGRSTVNSRTNCLRLLTCRTAFLPIVDCGWGLVAAIIILSSSPGFWKKTGMES